MLLLLLLLVLVEVVGAVVVVWDVVLTPLAVVLEDVVVLEEEEEEVVVVLTRVPVVLAVAAVASGSLSIVPSALLTFDPRLFCMALLCLKTAKKEHIRKNIIHFSAKHYTFIDQRSDCSYIVHKVSQNNSLDSLRAASAVTVYGEKTAEPMFQLNYGHEHWVTTEKTRVVNASDQISLLFRALCFREPQTSERSLKYSYSSYTKGTSLSGPGQTWARREIISLSWVVSALGFP